MGKWRKSTWLACVAGAVLLVGWWCARSDPGDPRLRAYVHARPPVPVVFTSRSAPASLLAAAPAGEGFTAPGRPLWQASEGRLRLLTPRGTVHELTWGKPLPDGGTLIDIMSPSVALDGTRVIFAGRRGSPGHGRFRLYEVGIDGRGLRPLTGGPDDPGCTALPPLRFAADGTPLSEQARRTTDYDDVDPIYLNYRDGSIAFASSRTPDLGRGHARRSTTLWRMKGDGSDKRPLTANRHNDRWPFLLTSNYLAFSLWSRNQEVITADERDVRPFVPGLACATRPADSWLGAFVQAVGSIFGALVKTRVPVWRPRPLFNGRIVFMTTPDYASFPWDAEALPALQVVQADAGLLQNVPSARPADSPLPRQEDDRLTFGPACDADGRPLSLATPSPCPPHHVVLAAIPVRPALEAPPPAGYGIYLADDDWASASAEPVSAARANLRLLFDDPELVDAEPVAVYARPFKAWDDVRAAPGLAALTAPLPLANGTAYDGPVGQLFNGGLYVAQVGDLPGQRTDAGAGPIFDRPPAGSIRRMRVYASRRDRFDDPVRPRVPGAWELLVEAPVTGNTFGALIPAGVPTVLAGMGADDRVVRWTTGAKDAQGRQADFYAFAGDHYSAARPGGQHFCMGCHPGHSSLARADHDHRERVQE